MPICVEHDSPDRVMELTDEIIVRLIRYDGEIHGHPIESPQHRVELSHRVIQRPSGVDADFWLIRAADVGS